MKLNILALLTTIWYFEICVFLFISIKSWRVIGFHFIFILILLIYLLSFCCKIIPCLIYCDHYSLSYKCIYLISVLHNWWLFFCIAYGYFYAYHINIVFILIFLNVSEFFYISGWITMSTLRIRVCLSVCPSVRLSPDKANFNSNSYKSIFEIYTYLN